MTGVMRAALPLRLGVKKIILIQMDNDLFIMAES